MLLLSYTGRISYYPFRVPAAVDYELLVRTDPFFPVEALPRELSLIGILQRV